MPRPLALALLFVGAAALSAASMLQGIQPNDEGLTLQAAARIADGQVPYRDFWWFYPPGQPYLLAALWKLFGPSLLTWRVVRVLVNATVALLAYLLARRAAPRWLALATWLGASLAMAYPSGPHPFPIALAAALGALLLFERSPVGAGVLVGVCAAWRIEFAGYLGLGVLLAYAFRPGLPRLRAGLAARFAGAGALTAAILYLPVVAQAGLGRSWDLIVRYPIEDFGDYQSLPFPTHYTGPLNTSSPGGFLSDSAETLLQFYLPLLLVVGLAGALVALALRFRRETAWALVAAAVFGIGMAHYLFIRPDVFHTAPLAVMVCVLAAWALAGVRAPSRVPRAVALVPAALAALALTYVVVEGADRRVLEITDDTRALNLPAADGVRMPPASATALEQAVRFVDRHVPPGQPIYVATRRSDLVTSGTPLFYVLADRPNPTRYDIQAPGVINTARVEREVIGDLERARPRLVVRWTAPVTAEHEPNRAGQSSGVRLLDVYLARRYHPVARFGYYVVLARSCSGHRPNTVCARAAT